MAFELNYDNFIALDAEALAEAGIAQAYEELSSSLRKYIPKPAKIQEKVDSDSPSYSVSCLGRDYFIYGGNDLGGMFLTLDEAKEAKKSLPRRADWPYLPVLEAPWYGQFH